MQVRDIKFVGEYKILYRVIETSERYRYENQMSGSLRNSDWPLTRLAIKAFLGLESSIRKESADSIPYFAPLNQ
jgi:hypothetical protein